MILLGLGFESAQGAVVRLTSPASVVKVGETVTPNVEIAFGQPTSQTDFIIRPDGSGSYTQEQWDALYADYLSEALNNNYSINVLGDLPG